MKQRLKKLNNLGSHLIQETAQWLYNSAGCLQWHLHKRENYKLDFCCPDWIGILQKLIIKQKRFDAYWLAETTTQLLQY